jgi:hypothetical protein
MDLMLLTDDPAEAAQAVIDAYESQRRPRTEERRARG